MYKFIPVILASCLNSAKAEETQRNISDKADLSFSIATTWNWQPLSHSPILIDLSATDAGDLVISITADFFRAPDFPIDCVPGRPYPGLWNYEVVEVFFLEPTNVRYVELEFSPCGAHLALLLHPQRVDLISYLWLEFEARVDEPLPGMWMGTAVVPKDYLPPNTSRFNAFAIHGAIDEEPAWEDGKVYEALFPVDQSAAAPDFHNLDVFGDIDLKEIGVEVSGEDDMSDIWKAALEGKQISGLLYSSSACISLCAYSVYALISLISMAPIFFS